MCVAIICTGTFPDEKELHACEKSNQDGGGIAWVDKTTKGGSIVRWKKGISADEINEMIAKKKVTFPCLIHFRIGTVGGKSKEMCHPFPMTKTASTDLEGVANKVMIHNGHWRDWNRAVIFSAMRNGYLPKGGWSDSRVMAHLAAQHGTGIFAAMEYQKIATLDKNGKSTYFGSWESVDNEKGIYFSNRNWDRTTTTASPYNYSEGYFSGQRMIGFSNSDFIVKPGETIKERSDRLKALWRTREEEKEKERRWIKTMRSVDAKESDLDIEVIDIRTDYEKDEIIQEWMDSEGVKRDEQYKDVLPRLEDVQEAAIGSIEAAGGEPDEISDLRKGLALVLAKRKGRDETPAK